MTKPIRLGLFESCQCKICLCWKGTRNKNRICNDCSKENHPGDSRNYLSDDYTVPTLQKR